MMSIQTVFRASFFCRICASKDCGTCRETHTQTTCSLHPQNLDLKQKFCLAEGIHRREKEGSYRHVNINTVPEISASTYPSFNSTSSLDSSINHKTPRKMDEKSPTAEHTVQKSSWSLINIVTASDVLAAICSSASMSPGFT